jgi:hypothetical protein
MISVKLTATFSQPRFKACIRAEARHTQALLEASENGKFGVFALPEAFNNYTFLITGTHLREIGRAVMPDVPFNPIPETFSEQECKRIHQELTQLNYAIDVLGKDYTTMLVKLIECWKKRGEIEDWQPPAKTRELN